jgi:hypothetical protein
LQSHLSNNTYHDPLQTIHDLRVFIKLVIISHQVDEKTIPYFWSTSEVAHARGKSLETFRGALRCTCENSLSNLLDFDENRNLTAA